MPRFSTERGALLPLDHVPNLTKHPDFAPVVSTLPAVRSVYRCHGKFWVHHQIPSKPFDALSGTYTLDLSATRPHEFKLGDQGIFRHAILDSMEIADADGTAKRYVFAEYVSIAGRSKRDWFLVDGQMTHHQETPDAPQTPKGELDGEDPAGTKAKAVHAAVAANWGSDGPPATLARKDAKRIIREWILARPDELSPVSDRTIERELDALKGGR